MTPQQQALIQKAARSIQSVIGQNETGFPEFAAYRAYYAMFYIASAFDPPLTPLSKGGNRT